MAGQQLQLLQSNLSVNRLNQLPKKTTTFGQQLNPLMWYTDSELRCQYHFGRDAINYTIGLVADNIMPETNRNHAIPVEMQVLITFMYLVLHLFLHLIGDTFLGFDKSTVGWVVHCVTQALTAKVGNFIKFPSMRAWKRQNKARSFLCWWISVYHWLHWWYTPENHSPSQTHEL